MMLSAPDDIPNSERIRTLIEDLWAQRNNKIRDGLAAGVQSQNRHFIGVSSTNRYIVYYFGSKFERYWS
jgi:hypothetical protein